MRISRKGVHAGLALAGIFGGLTLSAKGNAQSAPDNLYWIDHISVCRDLCPSMTLENCRCIKLKPVVVVGE